MRATFPQFVVKLKLSPQSGKTFNDNSTKRKPLSAKGATLPEAEIKKVRALCRLGISENGCMRERCRPPQTIVIVGIKGDKEGSTTTWNKSGLNNISKFVFWLSDIYRLFWVFLRPSFGACAPPSPNSWWNLNYLRRVGRLLLLT